MSTLGTSLFTHNHHQGKMAFRCTIQHKGGRYSGQLPSLASTTACASSSGATACMAGRASSVVFCLIIRMPMACFVHVSRSRILSNTAIAYIKAVLIYGSFRQGSHSTRGMRPYTNHELNSISAPLKRKGCGCGD